MRAMTMMIPYQEKGPRPMRDRAVRFAPKVTAAGRNGVVDLAQSGQRGPAGPMIAHLVQMGLSHRPQERCVGSLG